MPALEREIVLRQLASAVCARYFTASVERVAAWSMDMLARLSILEGAAGVSPGTWLRQKGRGFGIALDHFGPKLAASWVSTTNQGVYDKALAAATKILRSVSGSDPHDLVQDMISGSSSSGGPARSRLFYSVGAALRKYENDLSAGAMTPDNRRVKGAIDNWVTRAGRDVVKSLRERRETSFGPQLDSGRGLMRTRGTSELDDEERGNLILLALQSPGGPGNEVRRIIDREIDRAFPSPSRPIVRAFLEKIGQPKYRSPGEMKRMVSKFTPAKWFTQAYNLVRKEIMQELGVSTQQLTNALGGNAKKVFRFMRERIGKNPKVRRILEELAEEIEVLEPIVSRVAKANESELQQDQEPRMPHSVMRRWLEQKEHEANLSTGNAFEAVHDEFEMNEHKDWDGQAGPHVQHSRGPSPLRVAAAWVRAQEL